MRIRLVHAQVRLLLRDATDWDTAAWGVPISAAHLGLAISAFSARLLKHLKSLGGAFDDDERRSFMQVWRYSGFLMGIPDTILFRDEAEALKLYEIGSACEPPTDLESIAMSNCLVNSARYSLARRSRRRARSWQSMSISFLARSSVMRSPTSSDIHLGLHLGSCCGFAHRRATIV